MSKGVHRLWRESQLFRILDETVLKRGEAHTKTVDPLTGERRRNQLRAMLAPQRVKMEDTGSAPQQLDEMVARYN